MEGRKIRIVIFILSLISLVISVNLFWNLGVYVDEVNTSPDVVLGGMIWLYMDWLRLGFLALICLLSAINLFRKPSN